MRHWKDRVSTWCAYSLPFTANWPPSSGTSLPRPATMRPTACPSPTLHAATRWLHTVVTLSPPSLSSAASGVYKRQNKYGLVEDIEVDDQGMVYAPTKPGLGFEIDWDLVEREKVRVVR